MCVVIKCLYALILFYENHNLAVDEKGAIGAPDLFGMAAS